MAGTDVIEKTKYTEEELVVFQDLIEKKLAQVQEDLAFAKEELASENQGGDRGEEGSRIQMKKMNEYTVNRCTDLEAKYKAALDRIKNKTYGIDVKTGQLIPEEQLRADLTTLRKLQ